jgi:hypothetical protein
VGPSYRVGPARLPRAAASRTGSRSAWAYRGRVDRKKAYFWLMGTCLALILLAWNVVRLFSTTAAVVMSIVAAVIPPTAVIVANWGDHGG